MLNTLMPIVTRKRTLAAVPAILSRLLSMVEPRVLTKDGDNWSVIRRSIATIPKSILVSVKSKGGNINCNRYPPNQ
jgi:hypothetical protein